MARVGTTLAAVLALGTGMLIGSGGREPVAAQQPGAAESGAGKPQPKPTRKQSAGKAAPPADGEAQKAATGKQDPAAVQKALAAAQKSLEAGKADVAVGQIDALVARGGLDSRSMARALAIRGQAYRRQGKSAQAIADLQSALWLKNGLAENERASAIEARAAAYREAGLGEPAGIGSAGAPAAGTRAAAKSQPAGGQAAGGPTPLVTAAVPDSRPAPPPAAPVPQQSGSGGLGGFFSNLFGGGSQPQPSASAPATPPPASAAVSSSEPIRAETKARSAQRVASATAGAVRPDAPRAAPETAKVSAPAAAPKADAKEGRLVLRLAAQRTETEAKAIAERVQREHPETADRRYRIEEAQFGGMGTFYRADLGPFSDADGAKKLCAAIRGKGVDCQVVTR